MFATGLIVFRETLEAALFVSIIAAATKGTHRRGLWISGGVVTGFVGSLCIAALMGTISAWADGIGQDVLNVVIISIALALLTWHCVWVSTHGKQMAEEAVRLGSNVAKGSKPLWALSIAVALSVLREGAETVLFVAGFSSGSSESSSAMQIGMISGLVAAILVGFLIYLGLAKIKPRYLFSVTNSLIILLAGSLASQLAKALLQAGIITHWANPVWDGSWILSNDSSLGILLHALLGYDAHPTGLQIAFYSGAILLILSATKQASLWSGRKVRHDS